MKKLEKILFICFANIARSQMAEAFYNHYSKANSAISAGIMDYREKYNNQPYKGVVEVMREKGIDMNGHKIKVFNEEMSTKVDKIIVFCEIDKCPNFIRNNKKTIYIPLIDPGTKINGPKDYSEEILDGLRKSRDEIEKIVLKILR